VPNPPVLSRLTVANGPAAGHQAKCCRAERQLPAERGSPTYVVRRTLPAGKCHPAPKRLRIPPE
jgi:hypothetical protein